MKTGSSTVTWPDCTLEPQTPRQPPRSTSRSKFVADVREEFRLGAIALCQLRIRTAQLVQRRGELTASLDDLPFSGMRLITQLLAELVRPYQLGDILHSMKDVAQFAAWG